MNCTRFVRREEGCRKLKGEKKIKVKEGRKGREREWKKKKKNIY